MEVDGDDVVDRDAGQLLDGLERALRAAVAVGRVDLAGAVRAVLAPDRDGEVAREREHRDRLRVRVDAHEHDRVGARAAAGSPARVVAEDERDCRLARQRDVELLLGDLHGGRMRLDRVHRLVEPEVGAAADPECDRDDDEQRSDQDPAEDAETAPTRRRGLTVAGDGADRAGRKDGIAVSIEPGAAADASLQCRPHANEMAPEGASPVKDTRPGGGRFRRRLQIRPQPALDVGHRLTLPGSVVLELVVADPPDREVARLGVREVDAADRRSRRHREALGQLDPNLARAEQVEELRLLAVIGAGRVAERGPDAAEALGQQVVAGELLAGRVPLAPRARVQPLGEGFGKPVGQRLDDDRGVVVVRGHMTCRDLIRAVDRDRERADVVAGRRDVVGEAEVRAAVLVVGLLPEEREARAVEDDVVAVGVRGPYFFCNGYDNT